MPTLKIRVDGLTSDRDARRLENALNALPGVYGAVADRQAQCVEVDFEDDEEGIDSILALVEAEGFRARLAG